MSPLGLRPLPYRKVARRLQRLGFVPVRQRGSHIVFQHADGRRTTVPHHAKEDIGKGLLGAILEEAEIAVADFFDD